MTPLLMLSSLILLGHPGELLSTTYTISSTPEKTPKLNWQRRDILENTEICQNWSNQMNFPCGWNSCQPSKVTRHDRDICIILIEMRGFIGIGSHWYTYWSRIALLSDNDFIRAARPFPNVWISRFGISLQTVWTRLIQSILLKIGQASSV